MSDHQTKRIVDIVVFVTMPVVIACTFIQHPLDRAHIFLIFFGIISMIVILPVLYILLLPYKKTPSFLGTALNLSFFSNSGYLGIPIIEGIFGSAGLAVSLPFQLFSHGVVGVFTFGLFIIDFFRQKENNTVWLKMKNALNEMLHVPVFWSMFAGVILSYAISPQAINYFYHSISQINTALIVFAVGAMLRWEQFSYKLIVPTIYITMLSLFVTPLLTYFLGKVIGLSDFALQVVTIVAAMPTAVINVILAREYDMATDLAESVFVVSTVLSIITIPLMLFLVDV